MTLATTRTPEESLAERPRRTRILLLAAVVAVALVAGCAVLISSAGSTTDAGSETFTGSTGEVVLGDLREEVAVSGTLRFADPRPIASRTAGTVTEVPAPGTVVGRGGRLYAVDDIPTFLLAGTLPAWRAFTGGMSDGPDVRQLEENLHALGFFAGEPDERFRWATSEAIRAWQRSAGQRATGELPLGSIVFAADELRVGVAANGVGALVGPGSSLFDVTSTTKVVEADVRLAHQQLAALGAAVVVRLPGGTSTTGSIVSVGTPTERERADGQRQSVIPIVIALDELGDVHAFQEASVTVGIPSELREDVLSVPVGALLAISAAQFGVEVVRPDGSTSTVPVRTGLFAGGRVEISGEGLEAGQRVVVPER